MRQLVGIPFSPWTEKARWALDHHGLDYRFQIFLPMVGEPLMRLRLGRARGKITVPVLFDAGRAFTDSFDIARHADRTGSLARLFPEGADEIIRDFNEQSERALAAGRALFLHRFDRSRDALAEGLPRGLPPFLRRPAVPLARATASFVAKKHGADGDLGRAEVALAEALDRLRESLGGRAHLLDRFSYADIAMSVVLQVVDPVGDEFLRLGPATRGCWRTPALVDRFRDLLEWRDALYAKHRRRVRRAPRVAVAV